MMKTSIMPKKFRSVRDKSGGHHRRNKSSDPPHKARPMSADAFFSIFKPDKQPPIPKEKSEEEKEAAKMEDISRRLAEHELTGIPKEHIRHALVSKYAGGDVDKAIELLRLRQDACEGIIRPYNPNIRMLGAENRGNVTCYLDALLFAMFSKLDAFECMLKNDTGDENKRRLAALIRLWVNLLRTGKLVDTAMAHHIQEALASCGWKDAELLEQQDTSEAFAFITETLQLPLLTLHVDLFHQGKGDKDDHKVVYERLLNLAVPEDPDDKGIKLEDCLEEYFNNQVDVLRDSLDEKQRVATPIEESQGSIRIVTTDEDQEAADTVVPEQLENLSLQRRWTVQESGLAAPGSSQAPPTLRHRSTSVIQRIVLDEAGRPQKAGPSSRVHRARPEGPKVVRAVTIPAWQFFRLIPWHATSDSEPRSDAEVARQFNQRPVVGICLKRYTMNSRGVPIRKNTFIDIPDSLRLPHFMLGDGARGEQGAHGLSAEFKLVLQSVVCHRGDSLQSGHYVAFARTAPKLMTDNRRHHHDPPPDYEEEQWVKFDDLLVTERVSYVDDIRTSLRDEMPYLLFYQVVPMVEVTAESTDGSVAEPPSYDECSVNTADQPTRPQTPVFDPERPGGGDISRSTSGYFDGSELLNPNNVPTVRLSSDLGRPVRHSCDDDRQSARSYLKVYGSRRGSISFSDSTFGTPAITPEEPSPAGTPGEESTAARLSRAAAKFRAGSKSRPTSQAGEGRISITMSRLGGLMRSSKEPLIDDADVADDPATSGSDTPIPADAATGKEKGKEKDHSHHSSWRDRGKSRAGGDKGKNRSKEKESKAGIPERECAVM